MGLGIYLVGVPQRPLSAELVETWLRTRCSEELERINTARHDQGQQIRINLHPAAEDVDITWRGDSVLASARTSSVGPGYHLYICDLFLAMGRDFKIQWLPPAGEEDLADDAPYDEGEFFFTGDRSRVRQEFDRWLRALAQTFSEPEMSEGAVLCMATDEVFTSTEPCITPLGPRSIEWLRRTAENPREGEDFYAWPNDARDAEYFRRRALVQLWSHVRWREPFRDDESRLLTNVNRLLGAALQADSRAQLPWREWLELRRCAGISDSLDQVIQTHAGRVPTSEILAGYRRRDVTCNIVNGWSISVPGSFATWWDESTWTASDGVRAVYLSAFRCESNGKPRLAREILAEGTNGIEGKHRFADNELMCQADFRRAKDDDRWVLKSVAAVTGRKALLTVFVPIVSDEAWAVTIWRSLRNNIQAE